LLLTGLVHGIAKGDVTIAAPAKWKIVKWRRVSAGDVAGSLYRAILLPPVSSSK
jgi:hypothetical protein